MLAIGDGAFGRQSGLDDIMRWDPQDEINVLMKRDIKQFSLPLSPMEGGQPSGRSRTRKRTLARN